MIDRSAYNQATLDAALDLVWDLPDLSGHRYATRAQQRLLCDVPVVYVLWQHTGPHIGPVYFGSTFDLPKRLRGHRSRDEGCKDFDSWTAFRTPDRATAWRLEDQMLHTHLPVLNKRRAA